MNFNYSKKYKKFRITSRNLEHNHSLVSNLEKNSLQVVKYQDQLSFNEKHQLKIVTHTHMNIPTVRVHMSRLFPNRFYTTNLLFRQMYKALDERLGKDRTNITNLVAKGIKVRNQGGTFEIEPNPITMNTDHTHVADASMREH